MQYDHLFKPLEVKDGPAGLYAKPRIWGGGSEWEDFQAHFSYGFLQKAGEVCHPIEGMVVHPYDEVLACAGTNFDDILDLGGEMSIEIGEEREEHIFDLTQLIWIPKGTPHGALKVREIGERPIAHFIWGLAPEYEAETISAKSLPAKPTAGTKYSPMVKVLKSYMEPSQRFAMISKGMKPEDFQRMEAVYAELARISKEGTSSGGSGMGYEALSDERGITRPNMYMGPGNSDQLVWVFGEDMGNFELNFAWCFASKPGVWHSVADGHYHDEPEVLLFLGFNPDDLYDLGSRMAIFMGPEFEGHLFKQPMAIVQPAGFVHLPQITLNSTRTFAFQVGCLSAVHNAPWVNMEDFQD